MREYNLITGIVTYITYIFLWPKHLLEAEEKEVSSEELIACAQDFDALERVLEGITAFFLTDQKPIHLLILFPKSTKRVRPAILVV